MEWLPYGLGVWWRRGFEGQDILEIPDNIALCFQSLYLYVAITHGESSHGELFSAAARIRAWPLIFGNVAKAERFQRYSPRAQSSIAIPNPGKV